MTLELGQLYQFIPVKYYQFLLKSQFGQDPNFSIMFKASGIKFSFPPTYRLLEHIHQFQRA